MEYAIEPDGIQLEPVADVSIDRLLIEPLVAAQLLPADDRLLVDIGFQVVVCQPPREVGGTRLRMVLVESKTRKSAFLREAVRQLDLDGVDVETDRLESLAERGRLRDAADVVTLRAVRADRALWKAVTGILRPGGRVLWFGAGQDAGSSITPPLRLVEMRTLMPESSNGLAVLERQD